MLLNPGIHPQGSARTILVWGGHFEIFLIWFLNKVLREPVSNRLKICQKWNLSETIGIDSGGPESPFDALVGLFRAIFDDFGKNHKI